MTTTAGSSKIDMDAEYEMEQVEVKRDKLSKNKDDENMDDGLNKKSCRRAEENEENEGQGADEEEAKFGRLPQQYSPDEAQSSETGRVRRMEVPSGEAVLHPPQFMPPHFDRPPGHYMYVPHHPAQYQQPPPQWPQHYQPTPPYLMHPYQPSPYQQPFYPHHPPVPTQYPTYPYNEGEVNPSASSAATIPHINPLASSSQQRQLSPPFMQSPYAPTASSAASSDTASGAKAPRIVKVPDGYYLVEDSLGNEAFVCDGSLHRSANKNKMLLLPPLPQQSTVPVCMRIQAKPDKEIVSDVTTIDDVYRRIQEVFELQSKYRLSHLYLRQWKRTTVNDHKFDFDEKKGVDAKSGTDEDDNIWDERLSLPHSSSFTVAQFNALAEGLSSSSSSSSMPFPPTSKTRNENTGNNTLFPGGEYGGFTSVPFPEICLDFKLRKWRLLEVLLGSDIAMADENHDKNIGIKNDDSDFAPQQKNSTEPLKTLPSRQPPFDIIAIEEIDHYHNFFQPILSKFFGYDGVFIPKPSSPSTKLGWYSDGCAIFYKKDVFELLSKKEGVYNVGTQVYLVLTLRHRGSGQVLVVAATHLKAKASSKNEEVRAAQAIQLLDIVSQVAKEVREGAEVVGEERKGRDDCVGVDISFNANADKSINQSSKKLDDSDKEKNHQQSSVPIIIMGDFNADPAGEGNTCIPGVLAKSHSSPLMPSLTSVYQIKPPSDNMFTTWKTRGVKTVRRIIDYIFYNGGGEHSLDEAACCSGGSVMKGMKGEKNETNKRSISEIGGAACMRCTHILDVPEEREIEAERLPGFRYPSDHILIAARFGVDCVQTV